MERKEWNKFLDGYLTTGKVLSEDYEKLNEIQVAIIQEIKKSFARINKPIINKVHHSLQNNDILTKTG